MNIGIFGGTFDPIHRGHTALACHIRETVGLDEVWFLVTPQNPWKKDARLSADEHRLQMVRIALEGKTGLKASDYEFHLPKPSYSYQTLRRLREDFPQHSFTLIIGADNWRAFGNWSHPEEILQHHPVVVFPRDGRDSLDADVKGLDTHRVTFIDAPLLPYSSTEVRRRLAEGLSVHDMVEENVENYLRAHNIYKVALDMD